MRRKLIFILVCTSLAAGCGTYTDDQRPQIKKLADEWVGRPISEVHTGIPLKGEFVSPNPPHNPERRFYGGDWHCIYAFEYAKGESPIILSWRFVEEDGCVTQQPVFHFHI